MEYKNPEDFSSLAELKKYTINCIESIGLCDSLFLKNLNLFLFFKNLLQRHPDKYSKGVDKIIDISIRKFPKSFKIYSWTDYQIFIIKNDGTEDSISWSKSINKIDNAVEKKLKWAMRLSIIDQIRNFRNKQPDLTCEFCKTSKEPTVDHIIKFKKLAEDFISKNSDYPVEFAKNKYAQEIFLDTDKSYENKWKEYHLTNAKLRILCKTCNTNLEPEYNFEDTKYY